MIDTKFCTGCQAMRSLDGGQFRKTAGSRRWVCQACYERKSPSIYQAPRKDAKAQFDVKGKL